MRQPTFVYDNDRKLRAGITTAARIPHDDRGVHARRAAGAPDDGDGRACDTIGAWRSHDDRRDRALVAFSALDDVGPPATAATLDAIPALCFGGRHAMLRVR
jgi:hypothetical protein